MTATQPREIQGLHQDSQGLCRTGTILCDEGVYVSVDGQIYEPDGVQRVVGWYNQAGDWQRLRASNGFTFLVRP